MVIMLSLRKKKPPSIAIPSMISALPPEKARTNRTLTNL